MVLPDKIYKVFITKTPDEMGGYAAAAEMDDGLNCCVSHDNKPSILTAFGLAQEETISVISAVPLDKNSYYFWDDKFYSVRKQSATNRFHFATLIEIKKEHITQ